MVQLLVAWKADVHVKNKDGLTAADIARLGKYNEIREFLEKVDNQAGRKAESQIAAPGAGTGHDEPRRQVM